MRHCAWGEGDASFHRSPAKFSGGTQKKGCKASRMCIIGSMSDSGKSLVCDVVLGFLCPPALIGKLSLEAADIKAKERKEPEPVPEVNGFCSLVLIGLGVVVLIAKATGQI